MKRLAVTIAMMCAATTAHAETKRVAVIVGNNAGNGNQAALHYAEDDADKLARVLAELGGVAREDLFLLRGTDLAALTKTFARAKERIAVYRKNPANQVIAMFYFSGHSDGVALELGRDRLSFSELRKWLGTSGADVRVALVDSCKSGALLAAKGGTPGPAFQIRLTDDLASTGEALLTSSAANEVALESREIGGSFFTHHFVSGLRGAADSSGDGTVTLTEAYQYAYGHTITTTGETVIGPQHPAYDYRLSGQGELVLTELTRPVASIELPKEADRSLVVELARGQVIAELADTKSAIALQPGRYEIRAWRAGNMRTGRFSLAAHERRSIRWDELAATEGVATRSKGDVRTERAQLAIAAGAGGGVANGTGAMPGGRIGIVLPSGLALSITGVSRHYAMFRETTGLARVGYHWNITRGPLRGWLGIEGGGGGIVQSIAGGATAYSGALAAAPVLGGAVSITDRTSITVEGELTGALIRRDGAASIVGLPAAWLGIAIDL